MIRRAWEWLTHGGGPEKTCSLEGVDVKIYDGYVGPYTREKIKLADSLEAVLILRKYRYCMHLRRFERPDYVCGVRYLHYRWECVGIPGADTHNDKWVYWGYGSSPRLAYWERLSKLMQRDQIPQTTRDAVQRYLFRRGPVVSFYAESEK